MASSSVTVHSAPYGADVFVDGERVGKTPCKFKALTVIGSEYRVEVRLPGYRTYAETVETEWGPGATWNLAASLLFLSPLIVLTPFFTKAGVDGMLNPLALESIVHRELLPFERPFVLAHEWAHLAGQADEAEASAVGWLACMNGGPQLAYSASLYLISQAQAAMPSAMRRVAIKKIHPDVRADLAEIAERLKREDPRVQRAAFRIYDEYLKANRVEDGQASYGRALTLILTPKFLDTLYR